MEKAIFRASLVLAASVVFAAVWLSFIFRYNVEVWGRAIIVHDRLRGTVERCAGGRTNSRCFPLLTRGMHPVSPPGAKAVRKLTDKEFEELMDRAARDESLEPDQVK